mmetsp:Transcript_16296/g.30792  ORF Transcript_16296/g.30792 Transcript_16296/m.30792 type:complete len:204 (-) Transcript_16296:31-642(-)
MRGIILFHLQKFHFRFAGIPKLSHLILIVFGALYSFQGLLELAFLGVNAIVQVASDQVLVRDYIILNRLYYLLYLERLRSFWLFHRNIFIFQLLVLRGIQLVVRPGHLTHRVPYAESSEDEFTHEHPTRSLLLNTGPSLRILRASRFRKNWLFLVPQNHCTQDSRRACVHKIVPVASEMLGSGECRFGECRKQRGCERKHSQW